MARPLRIEYPNAFYHIISRGQRRDTIFFVDEDKKKFLEKLGETAEKYHIIVQGYVLMDNHYHLLIETPKANISQAIHYLNASYSNWVKAKHRLVGSIFQGRYKAVLVDKDSYLLMLSTYIHLNPVRAKIVEKPEQYSWSSYNAYIGKIQKPKWLFTRDILAYVSGKSDRYKKYVTEWIKRQEALNAREIYGTSSVLGNQSFRERVWDRYKECLKNKDRREIESIKHYTDLSSDDIKHLVQSVLHVDETAIQSKKRGLVGKKLFLYGLRHYTSLKLREIGELMGMDYMAVSQMVRRFEMEARQNKDIHDAIKQLEQAIRNKR